MSEGCETTLAHLDAVLSVVSAFRSTSGSSDNAYHLNKVRGYVKGLFDRAPFRTGDRVHIVKERRIDANNSWGWKGAKHFLIKGALATVRYVDYVDGKFCADVHFDDESYVPDWGPEKGKVHMIEPEKRSLYRMWEGEIERAPVPSKGTP